jgi:hypothetical protein
MGLAQRSDEMAAVQHLLDLLATPVAASVQAAPEVALVLAGIVALTLRRHARRR